MKGYPKMGVQNTLERGRPWREETLEREKPWRGKIWRGEDPEGDRPGEGNTRTESNVVYSHQHRAVQFLMRSRFFLLSLVKSHKKCLPS